MVVVTDSVRTSVEGIYWLGFSLYSVYYGSDLMNLICWHVSPSVLFDPSHISSYCVVSMVTAAPGSSSCPPAWSIPNSDGHSWHDRVREAQACFQDTVIASYFHIAAHHRRPSHQARPFHRQESQRNSLIGTRNSVFWGAQQIPML